MAGVAGRDKVSLARSLHQGPSVVGLEPVVMGAEPVEQIENRELGLDPIEAVIRLKSGAG
jgi:hypothetical protein